MSSDGNKELAAGEDRQLSGKSINVAFANGRGIREVLFPIVFVSDFAGF